MTYYIEDSTSITAHGGPNALSRTEIMIEKASKFVGATTAQLENAANTLYDLAVAELERRKDPITFYHGVNVVGMPLDPAWLPGDSMRLWYRGIVEDVNGRRAWLDVDEELFVIEATEHFDDSGVQTWDLTLATQYEFPLSDPEMLAEQRRRVKALEAA